MSSQRLLMARGELVWLSKGAYSTHTSASLCLPPEDVHTIDDTPRVQHPVHRNRLFIYETVLLKDTPAPDVVHEGLDADLAHAHSGNSPVPYQSSNSGTHDALAMVGCREVVWAARIVITMHREKEGRQRAHHQCTK